MKALAAALAAAALAAPAWAQPTLAAAVRPYEEFRSHALLAWHPERREVLVRRRAGNEERALAVRSPLAPPDALPGLPEATGRASFVDPPARLSPDGKHLLFVRGTQARQVVLIDVATGRSRIVSPPSAKPVRYAHARFSADGRSVFVASDRGSAHLQLAHIDLATRRERALTAHRQDVEALEVSPDGRWVAFLTDEQGSSVLRFLDAQALRELPRPPLMHGVVGGLAWRAGSAEIGFHVTGARTAGDVFSYDLAENRMTRWTNGNNPAVNTRELPEPVVVTFRGRDGREHAALHYQPPERFHGKRPVAVKRPSAGERARPAFLGAWNHVVVERGVALVMPRAHDVDPDALQAWIASQPGLDAARVRIDPSLESAAALAE